MKGTLIIGHGSRYGYNKKIMEMQMERLREKGLNNLYIGFNEASEPSIEDSMARMADDGIDEIVAVPFFIASGLHMERDIPPKLGLAPGMAGGRTSINGKDMTVHFEKPFGKDPLLAKILKESIELSSDAGDKSGALIIGHGSRLKHNKETVEFQADELRRLGVKNVFTAFNEFNEPGIEETMDLMASRGIEEIAVVPLFISLGDHLQNDVPPKIGLGDGIAEGTAVFSGKKVRVRYLRPVGEDPRLTDVILGKIQRY